jgi:hypothetical protein
MRAFVDIVFAVFDRSVPEWLDQYNFTALLRVSTERYSTLLYILVIVFSNMDL